MKKEDAKCEKVYRGKYKISVIVFIILAAVTFILCFQSVTAIKDNKIVAGNKIVDAVVVDYYIISTSGVKDPEIGFYYRYIDDTGNVYNGFTSYYSVYGYEAAEKAIEEKKTIKIYIDEKGNSVPVAAEPSQTKFVTIIVLSITFVIATVIFFIVFLIPKKLKKNDT